MSAEPAAPKRKSKLLLILVPILLLAVGGGAFAAGVVPGLSAHPAPAETGPAAPIFFEMPDIVANLNVGNRRPTFIKLRSKLELDKPGDAAVVQAALPRLQDMFQTYLREIRPEELRNAAGTYRLREELIARASLAARPAQVRDVLFVEMLVQ